MLLSPLGGGRGLGRLGLRQRAHWQRNDISGFRSALVPALAEPSKRRVDEQGIAVDVLDQQAIFALQVGLEAMLQRVGALPRLHVPGGLKRSRPRIAKLHDGARERVPRRRGGEVISDEISAHGGLAISESCEGPFSN